jgi:sugar phosphate isomerase/epimerase
MRLGAPILEPYETAAEWVRLVAAEGCGAAYCPVGVEAPPDEVDAYAAAAEAAGIGIAEVGAWSNPLSPDRDEAERSIVYCQKALALADRMGARCCVNIAGSRGGVFAGPAVENLTEQTFEAIVASVQRIIDAVRPQRTFYTLETMPWVAPEDTEAYVRLIEEIDRERFAVHFDPVNLVSDPRKYYATAELVRDFVHELGPLVKSCHVKDIVIEQDMPPLRLHEVVPGQGEFDLDALVVALAGLDPDLPLMLEHLETADEYRAGATHLREVAARNGLEFRQPPVGLVPET